MADTIAAPNANAPNARATPRSQPAEKTAGLESETRSFARETAGAADAGLTAVEDLSRQGAEATRALAEHGRRVQSEIFDNWREAMAPFLSAQLQATRWVDEAWRMMGLGGFPSMRPLHPMAFGPAPLFGAPPADVRETDQAYEIALEAPGLAREDIEVRLDGDLLKVCGCKQAARGQSDGDFRLSERRFGRFARSFPVPPDVRREAIEAAQRDGLVIVTLPKTEPRPDGGRRIEVR